MCHFSLRTHSKLLFQWQICVAFYENGYMKEGVDQQSSDCSKEARSCYCWQWNVMLTQMELYKTVGQCPRSCWTPDVQPGEVSEGKCFGINVGRLLRKVLCIIGSNPAKRRHMRGMLRDISRRWKGKEWNAESWFILRKECDTSPKCSLS